MAELRFLSKSEQVAGFLRGEVVAGRWRELMPGRMELAAELGANAQTVEEALRQLEREGLLVAQGAGRKRRIVPPKPAERKRLTVGILMYESEDRNLPYHVDMVHRLESEGHKVVIAERTIVDLGMELKRVAKVVRQMKNTDAWVVQGGSREILEWMIGQGKPVMAQFGRFNGLPVAGVGVRKMPAMRKAVRRLYELGHRRIVMIAREERRHPYPAAYERAFLNELKALGIATGPYNLPEWKNQVPDFHRCLDSLFHYTPPTALWLSEVRLFVAAQQHLSRMGFGTPHDVSLICDDPGSAFSWCELPVSHIHWDNRPVVSRIVRWADRVSRGIQDHRHRFTRATFVEGGTIGPVGRGGV